MKSGEYTGILREYTGDPRDDTLRRHTLSEASIGFCDGMAHWMVARRRFSDLDASCVALEAGRTSAAISSVCAAYDAIHWACRNLAEFSQFPGLEAVKVPRSVSACYPAVAAYYLLEGTESDVVTRYRPLLARVMTRALHEDVPVQAFGEWFGRYAGLEEADKAAPSRIISKVGSRRLAE